MASQGRLSEDQGCANAQHIQVATALGHATSSSHGELKHEKKEFGHRLIRGVLIKSCSTGA